jgi:7-cyano-7-deazaguanine synthase in queuosine biosynthesis
MKAPAAVSARVEIAKAPRPERNVLDLDLADIEWHDAASLGPDGLDRRALDLLEIARLVWEVERYIPKRISSQRVRSVEVRMSVREPSAWTPSSLAALKAILRLLGNAEWTFGFSKRKKKTALDRLAIDTAQPDHVSTVALFSAGLESTSGLDWLVRNRTDAALASFYGSKAKQTLLASEFEFKQHVQMGCTWANGRRRIGGQFQYRSFLFLALGAMVARSYRASTLLQFENGPLAIAMPPAATYRMTRHAHPMLHTLASELFYSLFGEPLSVQNPFLSLTKREAAAAMKAHLGTKRFEKTILGTETCWNLASRQVLGAISKPVGQPCGLCIPCVVRRTALPKRDVAYAVDLTSKEDPHFADADARIHVDAYLAWAHKLTASTYRPERFAFEAPQIVREAVAHSDGKLTMNAIFEIERRFAHELIQTFPVP